jgi:hypothetical protein
MWQGFNILGTPVRNLNYIFDEIKNRLNSVKAFNIPTQNLVLPHLESTSINMKISKSRIEPVIL